MTLVYYVGNFGPQHSTENDVKRTLEMMGHTVDPIQENDAMAWEKLLLALEGSRIFDAPDVVLWTSTYQFSQDVGHEVQREVLYRAAEGGIPTVGFHLDRWWGLSRWKRVLSEPFFRCQYVFTADGGHQEQFANAGVNHIWSPPAIAPFNAKRGRPRAQFKSRIAFVGSWQGGYHEEWLHRPHLVKHLRRKWANHVRFWPEPGQHAVRGDDLADLYASVDVVVGDSCLVPKTDGSPMTHYCSDRVFETIGRGGLLIHPRVPGVIERHGDLVWPFEHCYSWHLGEWAELDAFLTEALDRSDIAEQYRVAGFEHVAANHTYTNRMQVVLDRVLA